MDLHTRFDRFAGPAGVTPATDIDADLRRGRRAVRRRRTLQATAGSAFGAAAIVAGFAFTGGGTAGPVTPDRPAISAQSLRLVDYRGPQPRNFTVDRVPEGFFIQNDDAGGLTIAPVAVRNPSPGIDPSKAPMYDPRDLGGKIGIYLEQQEYRGQPAGEKVEVAGNQALLHKIGPTTQLLIAVSPKVYATVQFDVPLSREQMLELGAGLHVHQAAIDRMGGAGD